MKEVMRDVLGQARVERALGFMRERHAERLIAGSPPTAEQVAADEQAAIAEAWQTLRDPAIRLLVGNGPDGPSSDGGKFGQQMVIDAHRLMAAIPLVGDARFAEPA